MNRKILFYLAFCLLPSLSVAQTTGYLGRKLLVKTDAVNGLNKPFKSLELEWVLTRRFSLSAVAELIDYRVGRYGYKIPTGTLRPRDANDKIREITLLTSGTTKGNSVALSARFYFDRIMPAPVGYYSDCAIGFGKATFTDFSFSYKYRKVGYGSPLLHLERQPVSGLSGSANFITIEFPSFGRQWIIKRLLVLDARVSLISQYFSIPTEFTSALEHNYFLRSNTTLSAAYQGWSVGPAAHLKLGLLLF